MPERPTTVTVCASCLKASCWQGAYLCDWADSSGTTERTVEQLRELDLEHPDWWHVDE